MRMNCLILSHDDKNAPENDRPFGAVPLSSMLPWSGSDGPVSIHGKCLSIFDTEESYGRKWSRGISTSIGDPSRIGHIEAGW
jgi:hypothetical protein